VAFLTVSEVDSTINNCEAVNQFGFLGKYQFGGPALTDLGYKKNGAWVGKDGIESKEDFLASPEAQEKAMKAWLPKLERQLKNKGALSFVGTDFEGEVVTKEGLIAAAHLVGAGGVSRMLKTGEVPEDANGTKAVEYLKLGNTVAGEVE